REVVAAIADAAVTETRDTFTSARVALDDLRLTRQIARALSDPGKPTPLSVDAVQVESESSSPAAAAGPVESGAASTDDAHLPPISGPALAALRERLVSDLAAAAADVGAYEGQRALLVVLEAALR